MPDNEQQDRINLLAKKWREGTITPKEKKEFDAWYDNQDNKFELAGGETYEQTEQRLYGNILEKGNIQKQRTVRLWPRIAAAASIVVAIGVGGYFALHKTPKSIEQVTQLKPGTFKNDALPGNKAILTLANGQQLAVTSIPAGRIQNTNIQKATNGALVYTQSNEAPDVYNTLTVPRGGGKHELRLADGTLAVLDAGSSIRFPIAFNGKDRRVNITGQVYFEVIHNEKQPFYVTVNNQTIEDIGTHFNVNAFDGEIKTTLLEGRVKVNNTLLKPGQQAVQQADGSFSVLNHVDEEEVLAWKNGLFKFGRNTTLQMVMNQLSRWYDLEVIYEGNGKNYRFSGFLPRDSKLSEVCKILEYSGVRFSLEGKNIIVYQ